MAADRQHSESSGPWADRGVTFNTANIPPSDAEFAVNTDRFGELVASELYPIDGFCTRRSLSCAKCPYMGFFSFNAPTCGYHSSIVETDTPTPRHCERRFLSRAGGSESAITRDAFLKCIGDLHMRGLTPVRAIRAKCIDCSGGQLKEVTKCKKKSCRNWPYRFGKRPSLAQRKNACFWLQTDALLPCRPYGQSAKIAVPARRRK